MLKDLHIHIERGPYTLEWIEKFISKAQQMELDEICLLEHSIRFKDFLDFAVKNSVKFSTGFDAHRVEDVGRKIKEADMLISRSLK